MLVLHLEHPTGETSTWLDTHDDLLELLESRTPPWTDGYADVLLGDPEELREILEAAQNPRLAELLELCAQTTRVLIQGE